MKALLLAYLLALCGCHGKKQEKPNIMFFLMDDLGWADISVRGGQFPTPNLDYLYENGIVLNRHYIHLMCSPSRTQFITGRYSMYQGINKMTPWSYTQIGSIPLGQPTVAQWLSDFGDYRSYAVGKWQLGYAYEKMLPLHKGFDHFFGFTQGEVQYAGKLYCDNLEGLTDYYDFWEDFEPAYDAAGMNSMYQYSGKIQKLLHEHSEGQEFEGVPWYFYAALQTMHGPLAKVFEFVHDCTQMLPEESSSARFRYCENTLLTDKVIGQVTEKLKELDMWDNTIIVLSTDNGANLDNEGCNFPLRGTKGTPYDGNQRAITFVSGGYFSDIVSKKSEKNVRNALMSNLDWTPTLLDFAGYLDEIEKKDYTWDGVSQVDMIMKGDSKKARDHIVLNIGLPDLQSSYMVFEHEDRLFKYITASDDPVDRWSWYRQSGWCEYDNDNNVVIKWESDNPANPDDRVKEWIFDLTNDEREKSNIHSDTKQQNPEIVDRAVSILKDYTAHPLYSVRMYCLWRRLPQGDPSLVEDGKAVYPFLSKKGYFAHVQSCFDDAEAEGAPYSEERRDMYFNFWEAPKRSSSDYSYAYVAAALFLVAGAVALSRKVSWKGLATSAELQPLLS